MADESILDGLDPIDLLDAEADRVHRLFTSEPDWSRPSRCAGWTTRDLLAHLSGLEDYTRANLDGRVRELFARAEEAGVRDIAGFNAWQIRCCADVPTDELVGEWRSAQLANRRELRERGRDGIVDTMVGRYPSWLQTFHFAVEYATHGDDVHVEVADDEREGRTAWRATFGRFVLEELEKPVVTSSAGGAVVVQGDPGQVELSPEDFVDATLGRLPDDHPLAPSWRELLSTVP